METTSTEGGLYVLGGDKSSGAIPAEPSGCLAVPLPLYSAILAAAFSVLDIASMVLALDAWRRRSILRGAVPFAARFAFTGVSLATATNPSACTAVLPVNVALVALVTVWTVLVIRSPQYAALEQSRKSMSERVGGE